MVRNVGIVVFDGVEELDFVGPLEVFGSAGRLHPTSFNVFTVGVSGEQVKCTNGLQVVADYTLKNCPKVDVLVIPGGRGARREMHNPELLEFVKKASRGADLVASVCTGAMVLASAGLLKGKKATTHWSSLEQLRKFPGVSVQHRRYIRQGNIITSAGISAGIDMALYVVAQFQGDAFKKKTARRMEYRLHP
ncbi:MAG: DJ-1/PfpI family protein [Nitrososphaerales archaeon]